MRSYQTPDNRSNQYQRGRGQGFYNPNIKNRNGGHNNAQPHRPTPEPSQSRQFEDNTEPSNQPTDNGGIFDRLTSNPSGLINSLLSFIPSGVYNRETKKLFNLFTAEDLLLVALILMLADSDDNDDTALLIALVYILLG